MPDFAFENVKDELETDVDMGVSDAAGRDRGNVGGKFGCPDILRRHALLVMNTVPTPARAAAANRQDTVVIFAGAQLHAVLVVLHSGLSAKLRNSPRTSNLFPPRQ